MYGWETGIAFGQMIERLSSSERRHDRAEAAIEKLREDVDTIKIWGARSWLLAILWAAALGLNLPAEQLGDSIAEIIKLSLTLR